MITDDNSPVAWQTFFPKVCLAGTSSGNVLADRD